MLFLLVNVIRSKTSNLFFFFFGLKKERKMIISINDYASQMTSQKHRKASLEIVFLVLLKFTINFIFLSNVYNSLIMVNLSIKFYVN